MENESDGSEENLETPKTSQNKVFFKQFINEIAFQI